jgi:hypothetical protein
MASAGCTLTEYARVCARKRARARMNLNAHSKTSTGRDRRAAPQRLISTQVFARPALLPAIPSDSKRRGHHSRGLPPGPGVARAGGPKPSPLGSITTAHPGGPRMSRVRIRVAQPAARGGQTPLRCAADCPPSALAGPCRGAGRIGHWQRRGSLGPEQLRRVRRLSACLFKLVKSKS